MVKYHSFKDRCEIIDRFADCGLVEIRHCNGEAYIDFVNIKDRFDIFDRLVEGIIISFCYLSSISKEPDGAVREDELLRWRGVLVIMATNHHAFKPLDEEVIGQVSYHEKFREWSDHYKKVFLHSTMSSR